MKLCYEPQKHYIASEIMTLRKQELEVSEERGCDSITFFNVKQEVESSLNVSGSDAEILDK